ncbi:MAG: RNA polymerase sigma factor [Saprospiraceae bacterium]
MHELTQEQEALLAHKCAQGDRIAQRTLYELYKGRMFGVCLRYANNRYDAEDLLQEGFVKVLKDIHQFKALGSLEGWIRRVIVHVALQYIKKQRRQSEQEEQFARETFLEEANTSVFDTDENPEALIKLMQKMPSGFRAVLNLYLLENYSHQQIAEELGISVGTSKSQLNRGKQYLKNLLEKNLAN